jgi:hypothetical protein
MNGSITVSNPSPEAIAAGKKLTLALHLHEAGVSMMRQNLKRRHPDASVDEIEERLVQWLQGHALMGIPTSKFGPNGRTVV